MSKDKGKKPEPIKEEKKKKSRPTKLVMNDRGFTSVQDGYAYMRGKFGEGRVHTGAKMLEDRPRIPLGIFPFDFAAAGGIPIYARTMFWGGESGGKTTGLLSACAMTQRICFRCFEMKEYCTCKNKSPLEKKALLIDIETDLDKVWAECIGVDTSKMIVLEPDTAEQACSMALLALQMEEVGLVGFDSIGALGTLAELTREMEEKEMGSQAGVLTKFVRKMLRVMQRRQQANIPIAFLWINQMRHKIGVMFGTPEHYPGGWAVRHANTFVTQFKRITHSEGDKERYIDKENSLMTAVRHSVSFQKHKVSILQGHCEFVRVEQDLPDIGLKKGQVNDYLTTAAKAVEMGMIDTKSRKLQDQWKEEPLVYAKFKMDLIKKAKEQTANRG